MIRGPSSSQNLINSGAAAARRQQEGIAHTLEKERLRKLANSRPVPTYRPPTQILKPLPTYRPPQIDLSPVELQYTEKTSDYEESDFKRCYEQHGLLKTIGLFILDEMGIINGEDYVE